MKNLKVRCQLSHSLKNEGNFSQDIMYCDTDLNGDYIYTVINDKLYVIPSNCNLELNTKNISRDFDSQVIGVEYNSINENVYCGFENGDILRVNLFDNNDDGMIYKTQGGLKSMKLSPDHEILVLVTAEDNVITMISDFEIISENNLHSEDFGEKQFVTIGWGKKETQFHGSEGKAAAKISPVKIDENKLDNTLPKITWRGDGSLFAVSFVQNDIKARIFKVFNREGILQYTSELLNGIESCLSWKPSGSIIAISQRLINKHVIALFEKNGLKHREFNLPFKPNEVIVKNLLWSPDSEILTIWCVKCDDNTSILQLWTESNCHWYLKKTLTFNKNNTLLFVSWSSIDQTGKKLILLTTNEVLIYFYCWSIDCTRGENEIDKAVIGVIDGNNLLLTAFKKGIVPPPMAHHTIQFNHPVNAISFAPNCTKYNDNINCNSFCCHLSDNKISFFKETSNSALLEYECFATYNIELNDENISKNASHFIHHLLWLKTDTLLCSVTVEDHSILYVLNINGDIGTENSEITVKQNYTLAGIIEHILSSPDTNIVHIVENSSLIKFNLENELIPTEITLPELSYHVDIIKIGKRLVTFALSYKNRFSIDGKEIANNITSFYVHSDFLLLTTLQHCLICVRLNNEGIEQLTAQDLTIKPWENTITKSYPVSEGLSFRRIERGSLLIVAISNDSKTVLQMPRGNLECIQPCALSLHIIGTHLNNCNYLAAFDLMRKQRINLNLIYDHNPILFKKNITKFISDIAEPNWLSLFISELQEDDVTKTIYASCYPNENSKACHTAEDTVLSIKVEETCELLRAAMEANSNADKFIQPILTSLVKNKQIKGFEAALRKIQHLRHLEESNNSAAAMTSHSAIKYLLYLVDVNTLYDISLGMYDFDLTLFVASKSQKDPKEYLPFLNELKKLDENYMKYSIDMYLKRHESALNYISKESSKFDECLKLICNYKLYKKGLTLFNKDSYEYKKIAQVYGDFLLKSQKHKEAGIMFQKSDNLKKSLDTYLLAGYWQQAIIVAKKMEQCSSELTVLYHKLTERLIVDKRFIEAASILNNYLKDYENAVTLLCEGKQWKNALTITHCEDRLDLIMHIKFSLIQRGSYIIELLKKNKEQFVKHKTRLNIVRQEIVKRRLLPFDQSVYQNESSQNLEFSDLLSDTSSITGSTTSQKSWGSSSSGRSYKSSKNRRKQERKLLSLKEGTLFEDLGLIRALYEIVSNTYKLTEEYDELLEMLIYFDEETLAQIITNTTKELIDLIEGNKSEIWNKLAPTTYTDMENQFQEMSQESAIIQKLIEPKIMIAPEKPSFAWELQII